MGEPLRIEHDVVVKRASAEALFTFVADPSRRPDWLPELMSVEPLDEFRFAGRSALFGHEFVGESEVVRSETPHVLAERVVIGARFTSTWTFESTPEGGTRVRHEIVLDSPNGPLGRISRRVLQWRLRRMQRASLRALERYVLG